MATSSREVSRSKLTSVRPPAINNPSVERSAGISFGGGVSDLVPEKEKDRKSGKVMAFGEGGVVMHSPWLRNKFASG